MYLPPLELVEPKPRWRRVWRYFAILALMGGSSSLYGLARHDRGRVVSGLALVVFDAALIVLAVIVAASSLRRDARARARWLAATPDNTLFVGRAARGRVPSNRGPRSGWQRFGLILVSTDGLAFIHSRNPTDSAESVFSWSEIAVLRVNPALPARGGLTATLRTGEKAEWQVTGVDSLQNLLPLFATDPPAALKLARERSAIDLVPPPAWRGRILGPTLALLGGAGVVIEAIRGKPGIFAALLVLITGVGLLIRSFRSPDTASNPQASEPGTTHPR